MNVSTIQFSNTKPEFFSTVTQRVNTYFKVNNAARTANGEMVFKTIFMFLLYWVPYSFIISGNVTNLYILYALYVIMGFGLAGIGLSVMHDANHGAYTTKPWINDLIGLSLNMVGGSALNWKIQHNVLHHTYTNIHDADEDISPRGVLRFSPDSPWKTMHRYQHIYAWFLYGLMTLVWIVFKDFSRITKYERDGLIKKQKKQYVKEWIILIITKVIYFAYFFALPLFFLDITFTQLLIGFLIMHYIAGFILAIIFQPAHVVEGTEYPMPDTTGTIENSWAIHQLKTTTNFGRKHKLFSWYVGGLNYQVEHHLFPTICHVHYRAISEIVEQTAKEYGVPYKSKDTFWQAIKAHAQQLKILGRKPIPQNQSELSAVAA